jgi:aspartyl protease family protein
MGKALHYFWIAVVMLLLAPAASAGTVYKCKSQAGILLYQETPCSEETKAVSSWNSANSEDAETGSTSGNGALIVGQGRGGHYFVDGTINDYALNFAIDTGATYVTIPLDMAKSAGLRCKHLSAMQTANGAEKVCLTSIQKLTFGNFTLQYVDALIAPGLAQPLLGMNVLKRFHLEQDSNQMRITKNY